MNPSTFEIFRWLLNSIGEKKRKEINQAVLIDILEQIREIENFHREQCSNDEEENDDEQSDNDNGSNVF